MFQFEGDPVKFEAASAEIVPQYQQFGRQLLADETDLYRKRLFLASWILSCLITCNYSRYTLSQFVKRFFVI